MSRRFYRDDFVPKPRKEPKKATLPKSVNDEKDNGMTFRRQLDQYLHSASLHGLRFIGDRTITWFERFFFLSALIVAFYLSGAFINTIWTQWSTSTIVVMGSNRVPVVDIPFPAVTICNTNLVKRSVVEQIDPASREFQIVDDFCDSEYESMVVNDTWVNMYRVIKNVSQPCEEMIVYCSYAAANYNCSHMFFPVLTDGGVCCRFNAVPPHALYYDNALLPGLNENFEISSEWNTDDGFRSKELAANPNASPRPVADAGSISGLKLVLNVSSNENYCSSAHTIGFKMLLHEPHVHPRINAFSLLVPLGYESRISIEQVLLNGKDSIRKVPSDDRQCLFQDENPLEFYRHYSSANCITECMSKLTNDLCKCALFYLPPIYPNATICGKDHDDCIKFLFNQNTGLLKKKHRCPCWMSCSEKFYVPSISATPLHPNTSLQRKFNLPVEEMASIKIFCPSRSIHGLIRRESVTFTEFISNIGGILGLFLGFSIISVAEIIYFVCIRPHCLARQAPKGEKLKSSPKTTTQILKISDSGEEGDNYYTYYMY